MSWEGSTPAGPPRRRAFVVAAASVVVLLAITAAIALRPKPQRLTSAVPTPDPPLTPVPTWTPAPTRTEGPQVTATPTRRGGASTRSPSASAEASPAFDPSTTTVLADNGRVVTKGGEPHHPFTRTFQVVDGWDVDYHFSLDFEKRCADQRCAGMSCSFGATILNEDRSATRYAPFSAKGTVFETRKHYTGSGTHTYMYGVTFSCDAAAYDRGLEPYWLIRAYDS